MTKVDGLELVWQGDVLDVVLARAEQGNLLTAPIAEGIIAALAALPDHVKLVRLRALGQDFCVGRLSPIPSLGAHPSAERIRAVVTAPPVALYDAVKAVPVPVMSVVRGRASGVGCALACVADLTVCGTDALFDVPELARDVPPTLVMSALVNRVPAKTLAQLILARTVFNAEAALANGLASQVERPEDLDAAVQALTDRIVASSVPTLRAVKQFMQLAPGTSHVVVSTLAAHLGATAISTRYPST